MLSADKKTDPSAMFQLNPKIPSETLSTSPTRGATSEEEQSLLGIGLKFQLCRPQMKIDADSSHSISQNAATPLLTTTIGQLILA